MMYKSRLLHPLLGRSGRRLYHPGRRHGLGWAGDIVRVGGRLEKSGGWLWVVDRSGCRDVQRRRLRRLEQAKEGQGGRLLFTPALGRGSLLGQLLGLVEGGGCGAHACCRCARDASKSKVKVGVR
jgi:hypothetical protein